MTRPGNDEGSAVRTQTPQEQTKADPAIVAQRQAERKAAAAAIARAAMASILDQREVGRARVGPRELKHPRSREYAIQTLYALKLYAESLRKRYPGMFVLVEAS